MPTVECECGRDYQVSAASAGKRFRCKDCDEMLVVPGGREKSKSASGTAKRRRWRSSDDDLGDEDDGGGRGSALALKFGEGSQRVLVKAAADVAEVIDERVFEKVGDGLLSFLEANAKSFRKAKVVFDVSACRLNAKSGKMTLVVEASGMVAGKSFGDEFQRKITVADHAEIGAAAGGGLAGVALYRLFAKNKKLGADQRRWIKEALHDISAEVMELVEQKSGRKKSVATGQAKIIPIVAGIAYPVGVLILYAITSFVVNPGRHIGEYLGISAVGGIFVSLIAYFGGLLAMPQSYFLSDAAGRKTMRIVGAKSPGAMKGICAAGIVACLAFIAGLCYAISTFQD